MPNLTIVWIKQKFKGGLADSPDVNQRHMMNEFRFLNNWFQVPTIRITYCLLKPLAPCKMTTKSKHITIWNNLISKHNNILQLFTKIDISVIILAAI